MLSRNVKFMLLCLMAFGPMAPTQSEARIFPLLGKSNTVRGCNGFICRQVMSRRGRFSSSQTGGCQNGSCGQAGVRGNQEDFEAIDPFDFKPVDGSLNLRAAKGKIFEADSNRNVRHKLRIDRFGRLVRQQVDSFGRPITRNFQTRDSRGRIVNHSGLSYVDPYDRTNLELLAFYNKNKQQFEDALIKARREFSLNGGQKNRQALDNAVENLRTVERFIQTNTPAGATNHLVFDMETGVTPEEGKYSDKQVQTAGLNFLLNFLNTQSGQRVPITQQGKFAVAANVNRFIDTANGGQNIYQMKLNNPYACSTEEKLRGSVRLDWSINHMTQPKQYYAMTSTPTDLRDFAAEMGASASPNSTRGKKVISPGRRDPRFGDGSKVAAGNPRVLEFQPNKVPGGTWSITYDSPNNDHGALENHARDPRKNPFNFNFAAHEVITTSPNGMPRFGLFAANGQRANSAPAEIAFHMNEHPRGGNGGAVDVGLACLDCHAGGFNGPSSESKNSDIFEYYADASPDFRRKLSSFYSTHESYNAKRDTLNNNYKQTLRRMGALITDTGDDSGDPVRLLPDFARKFNSPLTFEQAARELHGPEWSGDIKAEARKLKAFLLGAGEKYLPDVRLDSRLKVETEKEENKGVEEISLGVIPRSVFEDQFCILRAATWPNNYDRSADAENTRFGRYSPRSRTH